MAKKSNYYDDNIKSLKKSEKAKGGKSHTAGEPFSPIQGNLSIMIIMLALIVVLGGLLVFGGAPVAIQQQGYEYNWSEGTVDAEYGERAILKGTCHATGQHESNLLVCLLKSLK